MHDSTPNPPPDGPVAARDLDLEPQARETIGEAPRAGVFAYAAPPDWAHGAPRMPLPLLRGDDGPLGRGPLAIVEALLKAPARLLREVREGRGAIVKLSLLVLLSMVLTGLVMAAFSGGLQLVWVPVKLGLGVFFCAVICLPSLYIFSALAGAEQSLRETWAALLMGVALIGVLLVGFAPVSWVFSQATSSSAFMGALHLIFLAIASYFGLGLVQRVLDAANGRPLKGTTLFRLVFLLVLLQMTTTLRPLVGPFDGLVLHEKQFFLAHWLEMLS